MLETFKPTKPVTFMNAYNICMVFGHTIIYIQEYDVRVYLHKDEKVSVRGPTGSVALGFFLSNNASCVSKPLWTIP